MSQMDISNNIRYVGADDTTLDLFESQYPVPDGVSYNSYVILDDKIAVMDTVDARGTQVWKDNLAQVLGDREPDYLVVQHLEPDLAVYTCTDGTLAGSYGNLRAEREGVILCGWIWNLRCDL